MNADLITHFQGRQAGIALVLHRFSAVVSWNQEKASRSPDTNTFLSEL